MAQIIKQYKEFTIQPRGESGWWDLFINKEFEASLPNEEEARRVIWLKTGKEVYITEDMMTPVSVNG